MGVTNLWQILEPVQEHCTLSSLSGQTLAVDLSIWVCETQCVKQMQGVVSKPFLRNLFFRILHLLQLGIHLVFVVEGDAPDLKWETMFKRQQSRFPGKPGGQGYRSSYSKHSRRNFNSCLRECCELLDYLGIPYLQSKGEAEAMCAALDSAGLVDGCVTNDGDAFLYGARTVYRNFTMNAKDPHVESYQMANIEEKLGLHRENLVAMALLLGCDYLPKGVPGVGMDKAIKVMASLKSVSILKRFEKWRRMSDSECLDQIELIVRRKALLVKDFPQFHVIEEFMINNNRCPTHIEKWRRPLVSRLQDFCCGKLEWPVEYTLEKVLPMVTLWDMMDILKYRELSQTSLHLKPVRIVKTRVRQGVPCYEIEWKKAETGIISDQDVYSTIETQELFTQCYPKLCQDYEQVAAEKKTKTKGRKKKKNEDVTVDSNGSQEVDILSDSLANVSLTGVVKSNSVTMTTKSMAVSRSEKSESLSGEKNKLSNSEFSNGINLPNAVIQNDPHQNWSLNVKPLMQCKTGKVIDQATKTDLTESEEDSDEDEYIPLSQRIQLNLRKAKAKQKTVFKDNKSMSSCVNITAECKDKWHANQQDILPEKKIELNSTANLSFKIQNGDTVFDHSVAPFLQVTEERVEMKLTCGQESNCGHSTDTCINYVTNESFPDTKSETQSSKHLIKDLEKCDFPNAIYVCNSTQNECLNVTDFGHVGIMNFTVMTPDTTKTCEIINSPAVVQSESTPDMSRSLTQVCCHGDKQHSTPLTSGKLNNEVLKPDGQVISESTPSSCRPQNIKYKCLTSCLESPLLMTAAVSPMLPNTFIQTPPSEISADVRPTVGMHTDHLNDHSFTSVINSNNRVNKHSSSLLDVTDKENLIQFGNFQVDSSLLQSMILQQSTSDTPNKSDLDLPVSGNFQVESSLLKSLWYCQGKRVCKTPDMSASGPVNESSFDLKQNQNVQSDLIKVSCNHQSDTVYNNQNYIHKSDFGAVENKEQYRTPETSTTRNRKWHVDDVRSSVCNLSFSSSPSRTTSEMQEEAPVQLKTCHSLMDNVRSDILENNGKGCIVRSSGTIENHRKLNSSQNSVTVNSMDNSVIVLNDSMQNASSDCRTYLPEFKTTMNESCCVVSDNSPIALADRLRAKLRKDSCRAVLGDITGNKYLDKTLL